MAIVTTCRKVLTVLMFAHTSKLEYFSVKGAGIMAVILGLAGECYEGLTGGKQKKQAKPGDASPDSVSPSPNSKDATKFDASKKEK